MNIEEIMHIIYVILLAVTIIIEIGFEIYMIYISLQSKKYKIITIIVSLILSIILVFMSLLIYIDTMNYGYLPETGYQLDIKELLYTFLFGTFIEILIQIGIIFLLKKQKK